LTAPAGLQSTRPSPQLFSGGTEEEIKAAMTKNRLPRSARQNRPASEVLTMEDKPVEGLRRKKDCSILARGGLLKEGRADALISPGNTGGIVAASTIRLRPCREWTGRASPPSFRAEERIRAAGFRRQRGMPAHCTCLHFAIMGSIYSREILGYKNPRVGILSNGTEANKGTELTQEACKLCKMADLNFIGNVEGHDLFHDRVDVVVCDGFYRQHRAQDLESFAKGLAGWLKDEIPRTQTHARRPAGQNALRTIKRRMTPTRAAARPCSASTASSSRRTARPRTGHHERHRRMPSRPCNITSTK
jgi:phosphate acyltransferase